MLLLSFYVMLKKISHLKLAGFHSNLNLPITLHHDSPLVLESCTLSPFSSTHSKMVLFNVCWQIKAFEWNCWFRIMIVWIIKKKNSVQDGNGNQMEDKPPSEVLTFSSRAGLMCAIYGYVDYISGMKIFFLIVLLFALEPFKLRISNLRKQLFS